ncbi:MAG TPA: hypothetical protein HA254_03385 [Candidatus Diapherotrites archaeon]|uniref:Uncharacterized protein n=1 Tax=Candidatus Iainarchaeum sp. TaxID=3101447 RepID=A0A7J4IVZ4_9ARCH|nr:hypothetical protein [Candidatus Diapherotrites archaeon]
MLQITNEFRPFRLKISHKEPVKMKIAIKNLSGKPELVSYSMVLPSTLTLDDASFKSQHSAKIGELAGGKTFEEFFELYPRPVCEAGVHTITIKATEHYRSYEYVQRAYTKKAELNVDG